MAGSTTGESSTGRATPAITVAQLPIKKNLKVHMPKTFSGKRSELKAFLTQCELFIGFNSTQFNNETEKILWIITLLEGPAFSWIEPFLDDFLATQTKDGVPLVKAGLGTQGLFISLNGFKKGINQVYGDIDKQRTAKRALLGLKQKGSTSTYTAEFQQYAAKVGWNDQAIKA
jgi:hypothetical protein